MSATIARLSYRAAHRQVDLWRSKLPWIRPHYAVKCNDIPQLLTWFHECGIGFDCASPGEVHSVLSIGATPDKIIYANPCKATDDVVECQKNGVSLTVVDSVEEVKNLANSGWGGEILVRLAVPDGESRHKFSTKFGASIDECLSILQCIREHGLLFSGFSFHVGSECMNPAQYYTAIQITAKAKQMAELVGLKAQVIDVGGGFSWDTASFSGAANEIEKARKHFFAYSDCQWIAEPGRFFAQPTVSLYIPIIAVRRTRTKCSYTLNESIYGMFSCIPFDSQKITFYSDNTHELEMKDYILFGRTCDSADVLGHARLPMLNCGDVLRVENMGAYTYVSSSKFNGFDKPHVEITE
jgi:ornithine decarboxylase